LTTSEAIAWLVACPVAQRIVSSVGLEGVCWIPTTVAEPCWWQPLNLSVPTPVMKFDVEMALEQTLVPPAAAELGPAVVASAPPARMTNDPDTAARVRTRKSR
jgi:hypothetical protein